MLPLVVVAEGLTKLSVKEGKIKIKGGMEIKEYISLEELIPKTYVTNWIRVRKVVKALGVI